MKRMDRKCLVGFIKGCLLCMLLILPSFVYADVTIDTPETNMVDMETVNPTAGRNASITATGSVVTTDLVAMWASVDGWSITVNSGRQLSGGGAAVLFSDRNDFDNLDDWTFLSGTMTNYGDIYGSLAGVVMGHGTVTNYGTISGVVFISWNAQPTWTATVTNYGTIQNNNADGESVQIGRVGTGIVTNYGTIQGNVYGVSLSNVGTAMVTNSAGGLISGGTGIFGEGAGNTTILNYGTITGTGVKAISLEGTNNQVTLGTGSIINGNIVAEAAYDAGNANAFFLDGRGSVGASKIVNFNTLNKTGAGTWILTGDMDYTSGGGRLMPISVDAGVLAFGGVVTTSSFTQNAGASLGFAVAPAQAIALTVTSAANFNNGTIVVIPTVGTYAATTTYSNILTVDSITNPWAQVTSTSAFLSPLLIETGVGTKIYDLILTRQSFTTGSLSNSNTSLGAALDGMYEGATGDMRDILNALILLGPGAAQTALTQMSGETDTSFQFLSFYGLNQYHGAVNNHLSGGSGFTGGSGLGFASKQNGYPQGMQMAIAGGGNTMSDMAPILLAMAGNGGQLASGTNWGLWLDGYYSRGNSRADEVITRYKQKLYGALIGFDYLAADNLLIGVSAGLSRTNVDFEYLLDKGQVDSYQGSVYTYYDGKPWYAQAVLTYAYNTYEMDRWINVGSITRVANADYKGNEYSGYAELGYKLDVGGIFVIQPMAAFQASYLIQDDYTETGADDLNLIVDSRDTGSYQSFLGVHVSKAITIGNFVLTPDARVKWAHEYSTNDNLINARFSGAGSGSFTVVSDRPSRDTAIAGVGLTGRFNKNLSMYIQYDAELNSDYINHTGMMGLRFAW